MISIEIINIISYSKEIIQLLRFFNVYEVPDTSGFIPLVKMNNRLSI